MALEIASGIAYLHEKEMIHGELRSEIICIDEKENAKIAEFGIMMRTGEGKFYFPGEKPNGVMDYLPPEILDIKSFRMIRKSTDIFAFGVLL